MPLPAAGAPQYSKAHAAAGWHTWERDSRYSRNNALDWLGDVWRHSRGLTPQVSLNYATLLWLKIFLSVEFWKEGICSLDVASGLQASARMVQTAEGGIKQSMAYLQSATAHTILPAVRQRLPGARGKMAHISLYGLTGKHRFIPRCLIQQASPTPSAKLARAGRVEGLLLRNSKLPYSEVKVLQLAGVLKIAAKRVRFTMAAINLVKNTFPETYSRPRSRSS